MGSSKKKFIPLLLPFLTTTRVSFSKHWLLVLWEKDLPMVTYTQQELTLKMIPLPRVVYFCFITSASTARFDNVMAMFAVAKINEKSKLRGFGAFQGATHEEIFKLHHRTAEEKKREQKWWISFTTRKPVSKIDDSRCHFVWSRQYGSHSLQTELAKLNWIEFSNHSLDCFWTSAKVDEKRREKHWSSRGEKGVLVLAKPRTWKLRLISSCKFLYAWYFL